MFKCLLFGIIIFIYISMVYPTLNIDSLEKRCKSDLEQFYKLYQIDPKSTEFMEETSLKLETNPEVTKTNIEKKIVEFVSRMKKMVESDVFDYAHNVPYLSDFEQKKLWIVRTFLFYQLLIVLTMTLKNKHLYNQIYKDTQKYPFRDDLIPQLNDFKMGIFGSITPQSDIDIGIQYSGDQKKLTKPGLAHIVSRFENLFILLTGINSLGFDIETYADMMTIPNFNEQSGGVLTARRQRPMAMAMPREDDELNRVSETTSVSPYASMAKAESLPEPDRISLFTPEPDVVSEDYFYLDTSDFTQKHFQEISMIAGTSILRNVLLYHMEVLERKLTKEEATDILNKFSFERDAISLNSVSGEFYEKIKASLPPNWLKEASSIVIDFLTSSYDQGREKYYDLVFQAEQGKFDATNDLASLGPDQICDLVKIIGLALTYRMESYTCAPTVIHVVRILQASKEKAEKYKTLTPSSYCVGMVQHLDPFCTIGEYGYALSCLEQIGYLYRFHQTYCVKPTSKEDKLGSHYNEAKCTKKKKKYMGRLENGYFFYLQLTDKKALNKIGGRKRKFTHQMLNRLRGKKVSKKSKKNKKKTKKLSKKKRNKTKSKSK